MEAVLDTNLLISGVLWKGIPFQLLQWAENGMLVIYSSQEILAEVHRVLHYQKLSKFIDTMECSPNDLFAKLTSLCSLVQVTQKVTGVCVDPDDDKFLSCALSANVEYLVSGDKHLLDIKKYLFLQILTATQFYQKHVHLCTEPTHKLITG